MTKRAHRTIRTFSIAVAALLIYPSVALAGHQAPAPGGDWVWQDGHGQSGQGFYRQRHRDGMRWVRGRRGHDGRVVAPHWEPIRSRPRHVWVRGHRGPDGYWINGHWRQARRTGFRWIAGSLVGGIWNPGYWAPIRVRHGHIWVPGYYTELGLWIEGYWRPVRRHGFAWVTGGWRRGAWTAGYWRPLRQRRDHVWVNGHHGNRGWVAGYWRPKARRGYAWVDGRRNGKRGWAKGHWAKAHGPAKAKPAHYKGGKSHNGWSAASPDRRGRRGMDATPDRRGRDRAWNGGSQRPRGDRHVDGRSDRGPRANQPAAPRGRQGKGNQRGKGGKGGKGGRGGKHSV